MAAPVERFPVDSHCHLRVPVVAAAAASGSSGNENANPQEDQFVNFLELATLSSPCPLVCATAPCTDWNLLATLSRKKLSSSASSTPSKIRVGFGVHPWWVKELPQSVNIDGISPGNQEQQQQQQQQSLPPPWLTSLVSLLEEFPSAIVGEIGLDKIKCADNEEMARQISVFEMQMDVAARMRRPVSVHCVRAFGQMLDVLGKRPLERYPPAFIFHGFTGSVDFARSVMKLNKGRGSRFYFGFGAATTGTLKHFADLVNFLPKDKILIESDAFVNDPADQALEKLHSMGARLLADGGLTAEMLQRNQEAALRTNF